jgi:tetratricopeptide (TPR) repeat protein
VRKLLVLAFISSTMLTLLVGLLSNLAAAFLQPALSKYPSVVYGALFVTFVISLPLSAFVFARTLPRLGGQSVEIGSTEAPTATRPEPSDERALAPMPVEEHRELLEGTGIPPVGPLPPGSLMPLRPNPHFVGREDQLRQLETHLGAGSPTAISQVAAATGLGGIGKTQLAVEYAHRYGPRYPGGVFWLDMEDPDAIASQVAACGGPQGMDLPGFQMLSLEEQVARVTKEWEKPTPRLLIFDNVDDSSVVDKWRPVTGGCRVLITSRRTDWPSSLGLQEVRLSTLPRDKAVELLCKGRPETLEEKHERQAADAICQTLGDLPLAVALAGSYLECYEHDVTLSQYLEELREQPVLENPALVDFVQDPSPTHHVQNVAATFQVSYGRLDPVDESDLLAMRLFHLASHFAPVSIRRDLLLSAADLDPETEEERRTTGGAVGRLVRLGLLEEQTQGRLLLHRLLGEFARHNPAPGQSGEEAWAAVAESVRRFAHQENESGLPGTLAREVAHLRHLAAQADVRSPPDAEVLRHALGLHLHEIGQYSEAQHCLGRVLALMEARLGEDHPDIATVLSNLSQTLVETGDLRTAKKYAARALVIVTVAYGSEHPECATKLGNLGRILHAMGDFRGAFVAAESALHIVQATLGPEDASAAVYLNNMGMALKDMGDLAGARPPLERALALWQKLDGPEHPNVAAALNNLGGLLDAMGNQTGALQHYRAAHSIWERHLGSWHPRLGTSHNNIGMALKATGDLAGARSHLETSLSILRQAYGDDHPLTRTTRANLEGLN